MLKFRQQPIFDLYYYIRKLSKINKYQLLYSQYKETGIRIFKNECDLSRYQIAFLQYLAFYACINMDIYMGEVTDIVLEDDIYEDAYVFYKNKNKKNKQPLKMPKQNDNLNRNRKNTKESNNTKTHVVFTKVKK